MENKAMREWQLRKLDIGCSVKSVEDGMVGEIIEMDGACIRVNWPDGEWSYYHRRDVPALLEMA